MVRRLCHRARELGMTTIVNFMHGFPDEDEAALDQTAETMERLAPVVTFFNPHGVVVPFPGTRLYAKYHRHFRFSEWWLDPSRLPSRVDPLALTDAEMARYLAHDPALDQNFFRYRPAVRERIAAAVRFKAEHNAAARGGLTVPAAGLR